MFYKYASDQCVCCLLSLCLQCPDIRAVCLDLVDWQSAQNAVKSLGHIDLLVNNAGVAEYSPFIDVTMDSFDRRVVNSPSRFNCWPVKFQTRNQSINSKAMSYRQDVESVETFSLLNFNFIGAGGDCNQSHKTAEIWYFAYKFGYKLSVFGQFLNNFL